MRQHPQFHRKSFSNTKTNQFDYETNLSAVDDEQYASHFSYRPTTTDVLVDYLSDDASDSEMPNGSTLDISPTVRLVICKMLDDYVIDDKAMPELEFPSSLFCHERNFIRQQAQQRNLVCRTTNRAASRFIAVSKSLNDSTSNVNPNVNKKITFALNQSQLINDVNHFLQQFPITIEENEILQAKIQKTPNSLNDWLYCVLLRSGNPLAKLSDIKARVPDRRFLHRDFPNVSLPIDQTTIFENFHHLIENNKIVFINGPPSIGKSTRICQWIHDDHFDKRWPVRILHSCSNSLSAYALSSILSSFHQPIDCFTFDNLSTTAESNALITLTTHEFLLHTLISGDHLLKTSVTHLIVDNVHKRSHSLDMLLAYLKDAQQKFRHLKILLLQTTMQYDTLVKYFGNVATYSIETNGIIHDEIEEIFLDEILNEIKKFDQTRCSSVENFGTQLINHWCQLAEQSSKQHRPTTQPIIGDNFQKIYSIFEQTMSPEEKYLSNAIGQCFCSGIIEDFQMMIDFIFKHPHLCNYQHPLTLVTPLMCLSMWSIQSSLERFLILDEVSINLRAVNNFSAIDFARKYATSNVLDLLETRLSYDPLLCEQLLTLTNPNGNSMSNSTTMKFYLQSRTCKGVVDYQLILSVIDHVCQRRSDHIVVFLPGTEEIFIMNDLLMKFNLLHNLNIEIYPMIDSLSPWPLKIESHSRFIILCDYNSETDLPSLTIGCVIDTGINSEKCHQTTTSRLLPKYNWISQTSALERKYRAIRKGGICYRMYPRSLFDEKINENINAEMARQPLLENIMQAKLFAWTSCSVAEFMLKLPFPPPFATVRAGITQLKNLDLFDKWEDLIDMGAYCLALPIVELPYAMMIVYAHLFKCVEPILTIVSILTIGDPFQSSISDHRSLFDIKQKFASNIHSDHYVFYQLYEQWKQSTNNREEFCNQWKIRSNRMEQIDRFKTWLTQYLFNIRYATFFYSNVEEKVDLNENASCWLLIEAIFVRCLPQNLIIYDHHWSSIRNESIQLDRFSILNISTWKTNENLSFAICDDFIRTNKNVLIAKHCTTINPLVLLLFGCAQESLKFNEYEITLVEKNLFQLRTKINACLKRKLQSLGSSDAMMLNNDCHCVNLLVKVFSQIS